MATIKGEFIADPPGGEHLDIAKQLIEMQPNESFPREVLYRYPRRSNGTAIKAFGTTGTVSDDQGAVVVLDVGRWGSGTDGAASLSGGNKWTPQRDFGLVFAQHVCLCTFANCKQGAGGAPFSALPATERTNAEKASSPLKAMFAALDNAGGMGKVVVRRYLVADGTGYDSARVIAFTGDMHMSVVDNINDAKPQEDGVIRRFGRVTVGPLEYVVTNLIPAGASQDDAAKAMHDIEMGLAKGLASGALDLAADLALALLSPIASLIKTAVSAKQLYDLMQLVRKAKEDARADRMDDAEATKWFNYYANPAAGQNAAGIFESAGKDYKAFVAAVQASGGKLGNNAAGVAIAPTVVQMGDMFDLWVGFTCHYRPGGSNYSDVVPNAKVDDSGYNAGDKIAGVGEAMITHWGPSTLKTATGSAVADAVAMIKAMGGVFLAGNHDNYFGNNAHVGTDPSDLAGIFTRQTKFQAPGVYGEHGHQWPAFDYPTNKVDPSANCNNRPTLGGSHFLLGTNSPLGECVTQAAFIRPGTIRQVEGPMAHLAAPGETFGQRLQQIGAAADLYADGDAPFGIYVLAHTHAGSLVKCHVRKNTATDDSDRAAKWKKAWGAGIKVSGSQDFAQKLSAGIHLEVPTFGSGGPTNVTVSWTGVIVGNGAWVALFDAFTQDVYGADFWVWTDDHASGDPENGSVVFQNVIPGKYQARIYLFSAADPKSAPFVATDFAVVGVSSTSLTTDSSGHPTFKSRHVNDGDHPPVGGTIIVNWVGVPQLNPNNFILPPPFGRMVSKVFKPWAGISVGSYTGGSGKFVWCDSFMGRKTMPNLDGVTAATQATIFLFMCDGSSQSDWEPLFQQVTCWVGP